MRLNPRRLANVLRLLVIVSMLLSSLPPQSVLAAPPRQDPEPTPLPLVTPTPGPVAPSATPTIPVAPPPTDTPSEEDTSGGVLFGDRFEVYLPLVVKGLDEAGQEPPITVSTRQSRQRGPTPGDPAQVQLGLSRLDRGQGDEQGYAVGVLVVDADGLPVANGTEVSLSLSAGSLDETVLRTRGGQARTQLRLPQGQIAVLSAQAGSAQTSLTIDDQSRARPGQSFGRRDDRYDPAALIMDNG